MADQAHEVARKEIINLRRVVKGSKLGKHISENILIPILEAIDPIIDQMLDWIGWYIREEIKHILATAKESDFVYTVYAVNEGANFGKYTKIGEYRSSVRGGPPLSPDVGSGDSDIPQSGTLLRSIIYEIQGSSVVMGIQATDSPYHLWYNPEWPGKLFVADRIAPRPASVYGSILDDPEYAHHRPYFTSTIRQMKGKIKKQFRNFFKQEVNKITRRPTVRRAIEIHFRWIGSE